MYNAELLVWRALAALTTIDCTFRHMLSMLMHAAALTLKVSFVA
jgi:hypothetical protein